MPSSIFYLVSLTFRFLLSFTSPAPHHATISAVVPPQAVSLAIALQNDAYTRESAFETHGRVMFVVEWRGVPEGRYVARGWALLPDGKLLYSPTVTNYVR